jgi:DNA-binding GntR family transcriptional regulator
MYEQPIPPGDGRAGRGRASRLPAYLRIADDIAERISAGLYRPGDQLPTERELRERFGVSPMTVRRAINILLDRGLVTTTQGKGTFVRSFDLGEAVFRLQDVTDRWTADASVEVRLLEASIVPADERVSQALACPAGAPTVFLRRLILRGAVPLLYNVEYVLYDPTRPLVESQLQITSLEGLLRAGHGETRPSGELSIEAVALEAEAAALLGVPEGSPALSLEHLFRDPEMSPMSWGWFLCRADQFRLTTQVGAGAPEQRGTP